MPRDKCNDCCRPTASCYCSALVSLNTQLRLLIIQHPLESSHPFNTGKMAQLCLPACQLIIEEKITAKTKQLIEKYRSALLYPNLAWLPTQAVIDDGKALSDRQESHGQIEQLVVIDANWRKSKKMLHQNTELQYLPRISFQQEEFSNYQIRHSKLKNALSTIESIAMALNLLEPQVTTRSLLTPFNYMIERQKELQRINQSITNDQ